MVDAYTMVDERRRKVGDDVARLRKTYWSKLEDKGHVVSVPYKSSTTTPPGRFLELHWDLFTYINCKLCRELTGT
jgi:hypothetical protein